MDSYANELGHVAPLFYQHSIRHARGVRKKAIDIPVDSSLQFSLSYSIVHISRRSMRGDDTGFQANDIDSPVLNFTPQGISNGNDSMLTSTAS